MTDAAREPVADLSSAGFDPPPALPASIRAATQGAAWMPLRLGGPDPDRHEIRWADGRVALLASCPPALPTGSRAARQLVAAALGCERERLQWLGAHVPVGEVLEWATDEDGDPYLLTTAPPGSPAVGTEHGGDAGALITALALGLRTLHAIPTATCPFPMDVEARIGLARARVQAGVVQQDALGPAYRRYTPDRLLELLIESQPVGDEDAVVVHGAAGLTTVHLDGGQVSGYVEVAGAGVSDRYVDLAAMAASLARHVSPEALGPFFDAYGIDVPDLRTIDFYVLLHELV